jgi:lantibiotic modifying enzyme
LIGAISTARLCPLKYLNGVVLSTNDYIDELIQEFEQMYRFVIKQCQSLLAAIRQELEVALQICSALDNRI